MSELLQAPPLPRATSSGRWGVWSFRNKQIQELSTGTRRIAELACLVALEPKLLLLDEPSSGIAQRETEALGGLLLGLKADHDMTLLVIEHHIPRSWASPTGSSRWIRGK